MIVRTVGTLNTDFNGSALLSLKHDVGFNFVWRKCPSIPNLNHEQALHFVRGVLVQHPLRQSQRGLSCHPCCKTSLNSIRSRPRASAAKAKAQPLPTGQPPTVAWPQIEGKPLELHVFLVRHPPCHGDITRKTNPQRRSHGELTIHLPLKIFGAYFIRSYNPTIPSPSTHPPSKIHATQYPPLQTQDPRILRKASYH